MSSTPHLLTSLEAAQLLRVHPKQIYRLLKRGLPALRVGDEWRFEREVLLRWASSSQRSASGVARSLEASSSRAAPPAPSSEPSAERPPLPALLAANGDCAVEALLAAIAASGGPLLGFVPADHTSAAQLLSAGRVLVAGQHGGESAHADPAGSSSLPQCARIHLVQRQLGLATRRGVRIRSVSAIAGKRLASRPVSAGIRRRLDRAIEHAGVEPVRAYEHAHEYASHRDVVLALAAGRAEVGLTTQAWAHAAGFSFQAIDSEPYELAIPVQSLSDPRVIGLCQLAQSKALRQVLRDDYGYDVKHTGQIRIGEG